MRVTPTSELVCGLWAHLSEKYGSKVVSKADSTMMAAVGWGLDLMGILDKERFLRDYGTTLIDTIYVPFEIGAPDWALTAQMSMAIHEHKHVYQASTVGAWRFAAGYLTKQSTRAHYEAEAYRTNMEFWHWLDGHMRSPKYYAEKILNYGCGQEEVGYIHSFLEMSVPAIEEGEVISPVVQTAIKYLEGR